MDRGVNGWVSCKDRLPDCPHECTTDHTMVSNSLLLTNICGAGSISLGHMRKDGSWKLYGGDYDFMDLEEVTHWQPLPSPPTE